MADHIVVTLQMLACKYPDSAIILGADNYMDIKPILNCGLKVTTFESTILFRLPLLRHTLSLEFLEKSIVL